MKDNINQGSVKVHNQDGSVQVSSTTNYMVKRRISEEKKSSDPNAKMNNKGPPVKRHSGDVNSVIATKKDVS